MCKCQFMSKFGERFMLQWGENYDNIKIVNRWETQDCMSLDGLPYIRQYSKNTQNMFTATGFNKWGMTTAMVAAAVLCDLVQEKKKHKKK